MSQFDQIVKNIALENEKCGYNPEKDTNWEKLRCSMQDECFEHMDIKTKNRFRQTSKHGKSVFDQMLNFRYVIRKIDSESKKSNYNPKKDMNWSNLPMEMRLECIKRIDFKTRCRFRRTSKTEKSLVDSKKHQLEILKLYYDDEDNDWVIKSDFHSNYTIGKPDYRLISAIFKHAEVKNFCFEADDFCGSHVVPVLKELAKFAPFRFKRVAVFCNPSIGFFIKNCPNLEKLDYDGAISSYPYKTLLEIPNFSNVKEFRFQLAYFLSDVHVAPFLEFLNGLVQKWIDNDAEAGKSVQFSLETEGILDTLAGEFADRIIDKTDKEVRIRMDNETTQILLRHVGSEVAYGRNEEVTYEYFSCKVIPIDMPKSEFGNGDGWIQAVYERSLRNHRKLKKAVKFEAEDSMFWE